MVLTLLIILTISSLIQTYFMYRFLLREKIIIQKEQQQENSGEVITINVNDL